MPSGSARPACRPATPPKRGAPQSSGGSALRSSRLAGWRATSRWRLSAWATRGSGVRPPPTSACRPNGGRGRRSASMKRRPPSAVRQDHEAAAQAAARDAAAAAQRVNHDAQAAVRAVEALQHARRHVATLHEQEMSARSARRQTEAALAQLEARRDALSELDREHVGLAPAAAALLQARLPGVLGPLADYVRTSRRDAELAERLLGEWLHAVLVRDASAIEAISAWHAETQPGPLLLLPCVPGPRLGADGHPLQDELRVDGPAAAWVRALLAGHEVLGSGALRRANGAVFLDSSTPAAGPLQRRAELEIGR